MNKLKLIYGNMRALCEAPQMMMRYSNIEYSYKMVWDHFGKNWVDIKKEIIFNRMGLKRSFSKVLSTIFHSI